MKELLKAAAKSSAGTFITLLSSAVAVKIIAVFAGPAGIGLFSLLRQIQQGNQRRAPDRIPAYDVVNFLLVFLSQHLIFLPTHSR